MKHLLKGKKYFFYVLASTYALTLILFVLYTGYSYNETKNTEVTIFQEYVSNFTGKTNSLISSIDDISTQIAMLPSVNTLLYETEAYDLTEFSRLNKDLDVYQRYSMLNSIYLYFRASNLVFATNGGLDEIDEFQEADFLKSLSSMKNVYEIYPRRSITRKFLTPETIQVFTFVRQIPLFNSYNGYALINVDLDDLNNIFTSSLPEKLKDICIVKDNEVLFSTNKNLEEYISKNPDIQNNKTIRFQGQKFILKTSKLHQYGFDIYSVIPQTVINSSFAIKMQKISIYLIIILLLEIPLSWFVSLLLTKPLDLLIKKIQARNPVYSAQPLTLTGLAGLNQALEGLFKYEEDIISTVAANMPILKESILLGMLWGNDNSLSQLNEERFSQYGIEFNKAYYYAIICSIDEINRVNNREIKDQIRLYIKENTVRSFAPFGNIYGILLESSRLAFILNTDADIYGNKETYQNLFNTATQLHEHIRSELSVYTLFSFGTLETEPANIHKSYLYAANNLIYSSTFSDEAVVFSEKSNTCTVIDNIPYKDLVTYIINRDEKEISSYVDSIVEKCTSENLGEHQVKKLLVALISSVYTALWEKGINISANNLTFALTKITGISDFSKLSMLITEIIKNITTQISLNFDEQQNKKINSALDFIVKNYGRDISVDDISEHVGLNHIYLNRIFKLSTGKTLSEYLNVYRIEKSKALLKDTSYSINEISKMTGYNDVRSYIRFFKKFYGVTPNDFRNSL